MRRDHRTTPGKELDPDVVERPPKIKRRVTGVKLGHPSDASVMLVEQQIDASVGHGMQREVVGQIGHRPQLPKAMHEITERRRWRGLGIDDRLDRFATPSFTGSYMVPSVGGSNSAGDVLISTNTIRSTLDGFFVELNGDQRSPFAKTRPGKPPCLPTPG
jgi:hypothetical protein